MKCYAIILRMGKGLVLHKIDVLITFLTHACVKQNIATPFIIIKTLCMVANYDK